MAGLAGLLPSIRGTPHELLHLGVAGRQLFEAAVGQRQDACQLQAQRPALQVQQACRAGGGGG